jgi:DNA-damage-inducible protein J
MSLMARTAILQARVSPEVKHASEQVLHRIGLNMTEALELFLRRVIVDQRIPFEVVALDPETFTRIAIEASTDDLSKQAPNRRSGKRRGKRHAGG